jgi:hypothetical protein
MIDLVLIALLQAAAGNPAPPPAEPPAVHAPEQTSPEVEATQSDLQQPERRRCRREQIVGTRMTQRICTSESEDRAAEREARDFTNRAQSQTPLQGN